MKFAKGLMLGSIITASAMMMYSEDIENGKKKMIKEGKRMMKRMGW